MWIDVFCVRIVFTVVILLLSPFSLLLPVEVGCGRGRGWLWMLQTRHTCNQSLLIIHPIKACSCHHFSAGLFTTQRYRVRCRDSNLHCLWISSNLCFTPTQNLLVTLHSTTLLVLIPDHPASQHPAAPTCSCVHMNKLCSSFNYLPVCVCFGVRTWLPP